MATYYTQSGANGGDNNDGDTSNSTVPDDTGVFAFLGLGLALVCGAIFFIIWLVLAIWAYKDAKRRGMDAPIVWFLVVFFLGIIGLIIYLIVRPKEVPQNTN
ncbi:MAG: phage holin family protein, partial [Euryarchaeota archaeon]|nr:phage holin family protein [Euryarchaeota archaeon]